ncbi:MAG: glycosyltransferase family 39 protein [Solirubrobacterales bacterium]
MRGWIGRLRAFYDEVAVRERWLVVGAMALTSALVLVYLAIRHPIPLLGDMPEYDRYGRFFVDGKWWWSTTPFGEAHPSAWKAPGYPLWIGFWYELLGASAVRVEIAQALFVAPLGVLFTWLLGRRLFTPAIGIAAAYVVATIPLVWEWYGLLYPESLAIPVAMLTFYLFLERTPTPALAAAVGAVSGVGLLIRPSSFFLLAGVAAAFVIGAGWRRGAALTAAAVAVAALVVLPWTVRNYIVLDGFIPISVQDGALSGTFNDEAANDPDYPYAWRAFLVDRQDVLEGPRVPDPELRQGLLEPGLDYISEHPFSVAEAFYWNGVVRFWDLRSPSGSVNESRGDGRARTVGKIGIALYYPLLALAVVALWRQRRRTSLVVPLVAVALAASVVFTVGAVTRYRAPLEPMLAILAVSAVAGLSSRRTTETDLSHT